MKQVSSLSILALLMVAAPAPGAAEEGMYPLSELKQLDLEKLGLHLTPADLYNTEGGSLLEAVVKVGGCTGTFVSREGLILTNYHCLVGALQAVSTPEQDYVTQGFVARTRGEELSARGSSVRILQSYRDVSSEVLRAVHDTLAPGDRFRAIRATSRAIVAAAEREHPDSRADVAEMVTGRSYVLFLYTFLKDVRLVYVPPRSIGDFGGEQDNWVWPRHTGDFAFLRAYVGPDGKPADYSPSNIPYRPNSIVNVQPQGVDEEDVVFILGYPARTFRHRTADFLRFESAVRLPFLADLYESQISTMQEAGRGNRVVAMKFAARIDGLANTAKNYREKIRGMQRLDLVARKREEERQLQRFIDADPARKERYGTILQEIAELYIGMEHTAQREMGLDALRSSSTAFSAALMLLEAARERPKPDSLRRGEYADRNYAATTDRLALSLKNLHVPTDRALLAHALTLLSSLADGARVPALDTLMGGRMEGGGIARFLDTAYAKSRCTDSLFVFQTLHHAGRVVPTAGDPFLRLAESLVPVYDDLVMLRWERDGLLSRLSAAFLEVRQQHLASAFIPDANGTPRFTYGRIRGYAPADAVRYAPITTLRGVVEKTTGKEPYLSPQRLLDLSKMRVFGRFAHPRLKDVPVALLYNLDTTGGNSGSPLLNARGELVGVNFDRASESVINDYAWSESYSRSIAVDIRYVLWVTEFLGGASHIMQELGL